MANDYEEDYERITLDISYLSRVDNKYDFIRALVFDFKINGGLRNNRFINALWDIHVEERGIVEPKAKTWGELYPEKRIEYEETGIA